MAGAVLLVDLTNNSNPATTCSGATVAATSAGDKIVVSIQIPNSNPVFTAATFDGQALTEMATARSTRNNETICCFYFDDATGRASGKTVTLTWTNSGTQNGGGAVGICAKLNPTNAFVSGAAAHIHAAGAQSSAPSTGASGTPSDATANYFAWAAMGVINSTTGAATADNGYTALTESANTARALIINAAAKEFTSPPVATQTETWTVSWTSKNWMAHILLFKETVPSAPTITIAPAETGTETVGSTLSCGTGTWAGSPTGYSYQWYRDGGTAGVTWSAITGATASTYSVTATDIGSKLKCQVVATNVNGNSSPADSNTTSATIPLPSGISYRIVGDVIAQSDGQDHFLTLGRPVLAGDTVLICSGFSNSTQIGDAGSFDDNSGAGNVYVLAEENTDLGGRSLQVWSCENSHALAAGTIMHMKVRSAVVSGVNALNSTTINVVSTSQFPATGVFMIGATSITYTGKTSTSFTGCSAHPAYTGGEAIGYHGQSPYWFVMAINSGAGTPMVKETSGVNVDVTTPVTGPSITTAGAAFMLGFHQAGDQTQPWWTPDAGWTKILDTIPASSAGGETNYSLAAEVQVVSTGTTDDASGTTGANTSVSNLVIAYRHAGTTVTIGQATDTSTAQTLTAKKRKALGQAAEADTVQASTVIHKRTLAQPAETDSAQALANSHIIAVGQAAETDAALAATRHKTRTAGQATESDTTQSLAHHKTLVAGQAAETDTAFSPVRAKNKAVGQTTETDTALALTRTKNRATGQAGETDTAFGVSYVQGGTQVIPVGQAGDTSTAQPATPRRITALGQAAETDTGRPLTLNRRRPLGQPSDTSTTQAVTTVRRRLVGQTTEADASLTLQTRARIILTQTHETDTSLPLSTHTPFGVAAPIRTGRIANGAAGRVTTAGVA